VLAGQEPTGVELNAGQERTVEILVVVLALVVLDVAAQVYGTDSRPPVSDRRGS
jgi:hypothetical protein